MNIGISPLDTFEEYRNAWYSMAGGKNPFAPMSQVVTLFFRRIGCTQTIKSGNAEFIHPAILMAVGHLFTNISKPSWKDIATDFKIVQ